MTDVSVASIRDDRLLRGDERGAAIMELTVVLPLLFIIGLGMFEFGNLFYRYHLMENAVRDAARYAAGRSDDVCDVNNTQALADIKGIATRTGAGQIWRPGYTITVSCSAGISNSTQYYRGPATIRTVTVTARAPYTSLGFFGFLKLSPPTLSASHQERIIGGR